MKELTCVEPNTNVFFLVTPFALLSFLIIAPVAPVLQSDQTDAS